MLERNQGGIKTTTHKTYIVSPKMGLIATRDRMLRVVEGLKDEVNRYKGRYFCDALFTTSRTKNGVALTPIYLERNITEYPEMEEWVIRAVASSWVEKQLTPAIGEKEVREVVDYVKKTGDIYYMHPHRPLHIAGRCVYTCDGDHRVFYRPFPVIKAAYLFSSLGYSIDLLADWWVYWAIPFWIEQTKKVYNYDHKKWRKDVQEVSKEWWQKVKKFLKTHSVLTR